MTERVEEILGFKLDATPKLVYLFIYLNANERGEAILSYRQMCKRLNIPGAPTVSRAIKKLVEAGLITKTRIISDLGCNGANLYKICNWRC